VEIQIHFQREFGLFGVNRFTVDCSNLSKIDQSWKVSANLAGFRLILARKLNSFGWNSINSGIFSGIAAAHIKDYTFFQFKTDRSD
jgi:hypothetical protein